MDYYRLKTKDGIWTPIEKMKDGQQGTMKIIRAVREPMKWGQLECLGPSLEELTGDIFSSREYKFRRVVKLYEFEES